MCKIISASFAIPLYVSTSSISLIAYDRFRLVIWPTKPRMQTCTALIFIIAAIIGAGVLSIPVFIKAKHLHYEDKDIHISHNSGSQLLS